MKSYWCRTAKGSGVSHKRVGWFCAVLPLVLSGCEEPKHDVQSHSTVSKLIAYVEPKEPIEPLIVHRWPLDQKGKLGKLLFHDRRLSHDNTISCASCHDVSQGGDDGLRYSTGIGGAQGSVNSPTVLNATFNLAQFWDGRASDLRAQVAGPVHAPNEMGSSWTEVIAKLKADPSLDKQFRELFASGISSDAIIECIVAYERRLVTPDSPFDRYLQGDLAAVDTEVLEGYRLFKEVGCVACHHGKNVGGNLFAQFGVMREFFEGSRTFLNVKPSDGPDRDGLDARRIKVPTLRNIALTAPYLHDGSAETLAEAVAVMSVYQLGAELSEGDIKVIVKFLEALTGVLDEELK